jgi:hypothetical protein
MKKLISFFLFIGFVFANSNFVVPAVNFSSLITDEAVIQYLTAFKLKDLRTTKYTQKNINTDALNLCKKPQISKKIKKLTYLELATNKNATQIALIYFASCTDLNQNTYAVVNNKSVAQTKNMLVYYQKINKLNRAIVSSEEQLKQDVKTLCNNKEYRNFLKQDKHIILMIYTNKNATAFSFYLINHCPVN